MDSTYNVILNILSVGVLASLLTGLFSLIID